MMSRSKTSGLFGRHSERSVLSWLFGLTCFLALVLTACGGGPESLRLTVQAEQEANGDAPVSLTVLVIYNEHLFDKLSEYSAAQWFEQAVQFERDNPDRIQFDYLTWELMPGQKLKETTMKLQGKECEGLVFANYLSPGAHRARFNPERRILITLDLTDVRVSNLEDD